MISLGLAAALEQPQGLGLRLFRLTLVHRSLRRFLPLALPPGRRSGPLVGRELGFVLPPGPGPLHHRRDLQRQTQAGPARRRTRCGGPPRARCTPIMARPPLMERMTFRSSAGFRPEPDLPVPSSSSGSSWGSLASRRAYPASSRMSSSTASSFGRRPVCRFLPGVSKERLLGALRHPRSLLSVSISSITISSGMALSSPYLDSRVAVVCYRACFRISPMVLGCQ